MSAIDVVVVKQTNGSLKSSPFFIRFSNPSTRTTRVKIRVNDQLYEPTSNQLVLHCGDQYPTFEDMSFDISTTSATTTMTTTRSVETRRRSSFLQLTLTTVSSFYEDIRSGQTTASETGQQFLSSWKDMIENEAHSYDRVVPSSEFLSGMNLSKERTKIEFSANGEVIPVTVYLWKHSDKIMVSDVDGTLTKSDFRGHIMTALSRDYTHPGIPSLFSRIAGKGYKVLYLTSRSITLGNVTRTYIEKIQQDGYKMPIGPVITTPNTVGHALARELIMKSSYEFKKAILSYIRSLFDSNPFIAGWGNRECDSMAYVEVGVQPQMIFQVNPRGEIVTHDRKCFYLSHKHFEDKLPTANLFPLIRVLPPVPVHLQKLKPATKQLVSSLMNDEVPDQCEKQSII